jgi:predicted 3-demethylubiquinone-9 3-methyltransferase (glyoxalase superfamily)
LTRITPFLWYDTQAEEAALFYSSVFPNSRILDITRYSARPGPEGSMTTVRFELDGQEFVALNGGKAHSDFNESVSFVVHCGSQQEVDHFWDNLSRGGEEGPCGWLKDRYGLSWQIVPDRLLELLADEDESRSRRVMRAMLEMNRLDIAELEAAREE